MKKLLFAAAAALAVSTAAHASIIPVLDAVTDNGDGTFTFSYTGTLSGDQGLVGDQSELVIFDFAGYVDGSISADGLVNVGVSTELLSPGIFSPGGDDPTIPNLVFTWIGPDFQTSGGPFPDIDFAGLSAKSTFGATALTDFGGKAVTNNGNATGQLAFNIGQVGAPTPTGIPEPSSWALLIMGFGAAGALLRQRRATAFG